MHEYDLTVLEDEDGDMIARAESPAGHAFLKKVCKEYKKGNIVKINCSPCEFVEMLPDNFYVGVIGITQKILPRIKKGLH